MAHLVLLFMETQNPYFLDLVSYIGKQPDSLPGLINTALVSYTNRSVTSEYLNGSKYFHLSLFDTEYYSKVESTNYYLLPIEIDT